MITELMAGFTSVGAIISAQFFREEWVPKHTQVLTGIGSFQTLVIIITANLGLYIDVPMCVFVGGQKDIQFRYWE
ncbi:hypothetical protein CC78DRAFT_579504 [Lojkania enalia]|uniref:Uncharacterized protein n=1 Tax=Lojkania enalia TaxID=147567 RepID=A0A9P4KCP7_9PLEO|nr:hypothetical protein CC78DRAFT_579504 [Didymosphaeria enalia]